MRVIFLTSKNQQNIALSNMIHENFDLVGIVYENRYSKSNRLIKFLKSINYNPIKLLIKIVYKLRLGKIDQSINNYISKQYSMYTDFPITNYLEVDFINNPKSFNFINEQIYDVIVVSGTVLVKPPIISLKPTYGIINLHTGLSPYFNGGPSCTFWCLYENKLDYIGSTTMFIDEGIDSGRIILSDTIEIDSNDTHESLEFKAIDLGNYLVIRSIRKLINEPNYKGIEQQLVGEGKTYYSKEFTPKKRIEVEKAVKAGIIKNYKENSNQISTFPN